MPKTEAIKLRPISKCSAHIRSGNPFIEKPGNYRLLLCVVTMRFRFVVYSKLFSKRNVCIGQEEYFLKKRCQEPTSVELTIYSRLVTTSCCCLRLPFIITTSGMPKTETIN